MSNTYGRVDVMMGTGTGAFTLQDSANGTMPWATGVVSMACIDSDGNGRDELAVGIGMNSYTSYPPLTYNRDPTTGSFGTWATKGTAVAPPYYGGTTCVAVGDFLGTGTLSVLTAHSSTYSSPARVLSLYSGSGLSSQTNLTAPTTVMKSVIGGRRRLRRDDRLRGQHGREQHHRLQGVDQGAGRHPRRVGREPLGEHPAHGIPRQRRHQRRRPTRPDLHDLVVAGRGDGRQLRQLRTPSARAATAARWASSSS